MRESRLPLALWAIGFFAIACFQPLMAGIYIMLGVVALLGIVFITAKQDGTSPADKYVNGRRIKVHGNYHRAGRADIFSVDSFVNEAEKLPLPSVFYANAMTYGQEQANYFSLESTNPDDHRKGLCELILDEAGEKPIAVLTPEGLILLMAEGGKVR